MEIAPAVTGIGPLAKVGTSVQEVYMSSQIFPHLFHQEIRLDWFGKIILRALFDTFYNTFGVMLGRDDNHGDIAENLLTLGVR